MKTLEILNEKIIEELEKGVNPWRKPWMLPNGLRAGDPSLVPINYYSNTGYSPLNSL